MNGLEIIVAILLFAFQAWMLVDALRREQWIWAAFIGLGLFLGASFPLAALFYYFLVYRLHGPAGGLPSIEIPAIQNRQRISELQARIQSLDKAHHHAELGDVYRGMGRTQDAVASYRAAAAREPDDLDYQASLGLSLADLEEGASEAMEILGRVVSREPDHQYGSTAMRYASLLTEADRTEEAEALWRQVLAAHSYAEARVGLAQLHMKQFKFPEAAALLEEVIRDDVHTPDYQRPKERKWVKKAKQMLRQIEPSA